MKTKKATVAKKKNEKDIFHAKIRKMEIQHGEGFNVVLNEGEARKHGINVYDKVAVLDDGKEIVLDVSLSKHLIKAGEIGVFSDVYEKYGMKEGELVAVYYTKNSPLSVEAIKKKILGKKLSEQEITAIIQDISSHKLSDTLMTYYVASSFFYPTSLEEMFFTAKAMAEAGETLKLKGIVADKHCIGGVPGNETTMIVVPIIASLGITIPKSFSKAITSPAATGECVNTIMGISFDIPQIKELLKKNNTCLIRGGGLHVAPADDEIIKVSYPLSIEPHSKAVISIMAKKYAMGINHCLIDLPVGPTAKITNMKDANELKKQFEYIGKRFGMKMSVQITPALQPIGAGIGAIMQVREVLRVLQQHPKRPADLEKKAIFLSAKLIELVGKAKGKAALDLAKKQLVSGAAWKKMHDIIQAQGGKNPNIQSEDLVLGSVEKDFIANKNGKVKNIDMKFLNTVARALGAPIEEKGGLYLEKKLGDPVKKGDVLFRMYTVDVKKMSLAEDLMKDRNIYEIK